MKAKDWPRLALTTFILAIFAYVIVRHYSASLEETVKAIVMLAVGYWLGSSKGSADKTDMLKGEE